MTVPDDSPEGANTETGERLEARELDRVIQSLERAFPNVKPRVVRHAVDQAHRAFADNPIRGFVPALVERAAREALIRQTAQQPNQTHASPQIGGAESAHNGPLDASSQPAKK